MDTYTNEMTVLAPSAWDPAIRLDPPKNLPSVKKRMESLLRQNQATVGTDNDGDDEESLNGITSAVKDHPFHAHHMEHYGSDGGKALDFVGDEEPDEELEQEDEKEDMTLKRTGRIFGGLVADVKRKLPWYKSDFTDAFAAQTVASIIYIYLATVTKAITFGGFLGDITDGVQGVLEAFLGHALAGGFFCLLGGQPLTVLGCTGPVLIFEKILVDSCANFELDYMTFRLWIGLWSVLFCLVIVATDAFSICSILHQIYRGKFRCFNWDYLYHRIIKETLQ